MRIRQQSPVHGGKERDQKVVWEDDFQALVEPLRPWFESLLSSSPLPSSLKSSAAAASLTSSSLDQLPGGPHTHSPPPKTTPTKNHPHPPRTAPSNALTHSYSNQITALPPRPPPSAPHAVKWETLEPLTSLGHSKKELTSAAPKTKQTSSKKDPREWMSTSGDPGTSSSKTKHKDFNFEIPAKSKHKDFDFEIPAKPKRTSELAIRAKRSSDIMSSSQREALLSGKLELDPLLSSDPETDLTTSPTKGKRDSTTMSTKLKRDSAMMSTKSKRDSAMMSTKSNRDSVDSSAKPQRDSMLLSIESNQRDSLVSSKSNRTALTSSKSKRHSAKEDETLPPVGGTDVVEVPPEEGITQDQHYRFILQLSWLICPMYSPETGKSRAQADWSKEIAARREHKPQTPSPSSLQPISGYGSDGEQQQQQHQLAGQQQQQHQQPKKMLYSHFVAYTWHLVRRLHPEANWTIPGLVKFLRSSSLAQFEWVSAHPKLLLGRCLRKEERRSILRQRLQINTHQAEAEARRLLASHDEAPVPRAVPRAVHSDSEYLALNPIALEAFTLQRQQMEEIFPSRPPRNSLQVESKDDVDPDWGLPTLETESSQVSLPDLTQPLQITSTPHHHPQHHQLQEMVEEREDGAPAAQRLTEETVVLQPVPRSNNSGGDQMDDGGGFSFDVSALSSPRVQTPPMPIPSNSFYQAPIVVERNPSSFQLLVESSFRPVTPLTITKSWAGIPPQTAPASTQLSSLEEGGGEGGGGIMSPLPGSKGMMPGGGAGGGGRSSPSPSRTRGERGGEYPPRSPPPPHSPPPRNVATAPHHASSQAGRGSQGAPQAQAQYGRARLQGGTPDLPSETEFEPYRYPPNVLAFAGHAQTTDKSVQTQFQVAGPAHSRKPCMMSGCEGWGVYELHRAPLGSRLAQRRNVLFLHAWVQTDLPGPAHGGPGGGDGNTQYKRSASYPFHQPALAKNSLTCLALAAVDQATQMVPPIVDLREAHKVPLAHYRLDYYIQPVDPVGILMRRRKHRSRLENQINQERQQEREREGPSAGAGLPEETSPQAQLAILPKQPTSPLREGICRGYPLQKAFEKLLEKRRVDPSYNPIQSDEGIMGGSYHLLERIPKPVKTSKLPHSHSRKNNLRRLMST